MKDWQKDKALTCFPRMSDSNPRRRSVIGLECQHTNVDVVGYLNETMASVQKVTSIPQFLAKKYPNQRKTSIFTGYFSM